MRLHPWRKGRSGAWRRVGARVPRTAKSMSPRKCVAGLGKDMGKIKNLKMAHEAFFMRHL